MLGLLVDIITRTHSMTASALATRRSRSAPSWAGDRPLKLDSVTRHLLAGNG